MKLLGNRVIIAPEIQEKSGLIHLARMSRQMPDRGKVLHISDEAAKLTGVWPGEKVIFDAHHQTLSDDQSTTMVAGEFILAVYE